MSQTLSRKQVADTGNKSNAIFIVDNVVYNVTAFLDEHPGGHEVLLNAVGKDASEDFKDVGHSLDAKELMKKYVIGEVPPEDRVEVKTKTYWTEEDAAAAAKEGGFLSSWKLPVLLGILATVLYTYLLG